MMMFTISPPALASILALASTLALATSPLLASCNPFGGGGRAVTAAAAAAAALMKNPKIPPMPEVVTAARQVRVERLSADDVFRRVGLTAAGCESDGWGEVVSPLGTHQGVLCAANNGAAPPLLFTDAESVAGYGPLVSRVLLAGSVASSVRNRGSDSDCAYHIPVAVTLVESLPPDEVSSLLRRWRGDEGEKEGEWRDALVTISDAKNEGEGGARYVLYACSAHSEPTHANSDVYVLPVDGVEKTTGGGLGSVWKFAIEYRVATVNLPSIPSYASPPMPDVWLKNDCY